MKNKRKTETGGSGSEFIALFERALQERDSLKQWIGELSSKSNLTVRNRLCLALYRHKLSFREPPLPPETQLNARSLQQYWAGAPEELRKYESREREIECYLKSSAQLEQEKKRRKEAWLNLISADTATFLTLYPLAEDMFKEQAGRSVSRPDIPVRALQLKIGTSKTWKEITDELCDCGKDVHDDYCKENLCRSAYRLRDLLKKCGVEVPST